MGAVGLPEPAAAGWSGTGELGEAGYQEPLGQLGEKQGDGQAVFGDLVGAAVRDAFDDGQPVPARDRRPAVRLGEHRRHAPPQHLRLARRPGPLLGRAAHPELRAADGRSAALARLTGSR